MKKKPSTPTKKQFGAFEDAYKYFNKVLFSDQLPSVLLNLSRKSKAMGFAAPNSWRSSKSKSAEDAHLHELSINPEILHMDLIEIYSTLVHEMAHIWQFVFGTPSRSGYHNSEWANKMIAVGLMPSTTGEPGGKIVGQRMSDYPIENGVFLKALKKMPKKMKFPFVCVHGERLGVGASSSGSDEKNKKNKVKYTCPICDTNVWGKTGLSIDCRDCCAEFAEQ